MVEQKSKKVICIEGIVGRNNNTRKETLKQIAEDPKLDKRYTEVARTALEHGNQRANNLI